MVIQIYRQNFITLGFIPKPRFSEYYDKGQFFISDDGFILTGSLKSKVTPIYAIYVYPEKRNGLMPIKTLLQKLPKKRYRIRCLDSMINLWKRLGLEMIGSELKNKRMRKINILEGYFK